MDRRIIILIAIVLAISLGFLLYRKLYYKHERVHFEIRPRGVIYVGDTIVYKDLTQGGSRRKWDFGDGKFSLDDTGIHIFLEPHSYNVKLSVYGPFCVLKDSASIDVLPRKVIRQAVPAEPVIIGADELKTGQAAIYTCAFYAETYEWEIEGEAPATERSGTQKTFKTSFSGPGDRFLVLKTHQPDGSYRKKIAVVAEKAKRKIINKTNHRRNLPEPPDDERLMHGVPIRKQNSN